MLADSQDRWQVLIAICAGLVWGMAEASFFFIVPDVLLSAYAIRSGRLALSALAGSLAGACLGGGAMFLWAQGAPAAATAAVDAVPFIPQRLFGFAAELSAAHGGLGILIGSLSGVPYKIFAVQAPDTLSLGGFLAWTLPGRAFRCVLSATIAWALTRWLGGDCDRERCRFAGRSPGSPFTRPTGPRCRPDEQGRPCRSRTRPLFDHRRHGSEQETSGQVSRPRLRQRRRSPRVDHRQVRRGA